MMVSPYQPALPASVSTLDKLTEKPARHDAAYLVDMARVARPSKRLQ